MEERNCLEGTAAIMCGEGYGDAKFCASQGREIDADGGMGERSTVLMLGHRVVFTSRRSRESTWRSWSLKGAVWWRAGQVKYTK